MLKKLFVGVWLSLLVSIAAGLFWYNDMVYSLPAPVPENYKAVPLGTVIKLPMVLCGYSHKPLLLHFYNPDCPCSRFNVTSFKSLVTLYGGRVNFAIVVLSKNMADPRSIRDKLGLGIRCCQVQPSQSYAPLHLSSPKPAPMMQEHCRPNNSRTHF